MANLKKFIRVRKHPTGEEVEEEYDIGQIFHTYKIPFSFDSPGILAQGSNVGGFNISNIYAPKNGDVIHIPLILVSISTRFDGTTPTLRLYMNGSSEGEFGETLMNNGFRVDVDSDGSFSPNGGSEPQNPYIDPSINGIYGAIMDGTNTLVLVIDDGDGGDPNDPDPITQGEGYLLLPVSHGAAA